MSARIGVLAWVLGGLGCTASLSPAAPGDTSQAVCDTSGLQPAEARGIRRLTGPQYTNALRDVFPTAALDVQSFPAPILARGFDNNAELQNPSPAWVEAFQRAAEATTTALAQKPAAVDPCLSASSPADEMACGQTLVRKLGRKLFRRQLTDDEATRYLVLFEAQRQASGFQVAWQVLLQALLQAPQFVYFPELGVGDASAGSVALEAHEVAARLALFLWESIPDDALLDAADQGHLVTADDVEAQARRMLADPRARAALASFHRQWLDVVRLDTTTKDPTLFPDFGEPTRQAMRDELDRFVTDIVIDGDGTLESLFTSPRTFVNATLAPIYGVTASGSDFAPISLDPSQRAGIFTLSGFLASHAHQVDPSPVLRGVFVLDRLFCSPPPPPPPGVKTSVPVDANSPKTNRDRVAAHVNNATCAACHKRIDGIGFNFEKYDTLGRFRLTDGGEAVDASGELVGTDIDGPTSDAVDLAHRLSQSAQVRTCVSTQWFRWAYGRGETAGDQCNLKALSAELSAANGNVRELIVRLVRSPAFLRVRNVAN